MAEGEVERALSSMSSMLIFDSKKHRIIQPENLDTKGSRDISLSVKKNSKLDLKIMKLLSRIFENQMGLFMAYRHLPEQV